MPNATNMHPLDALMCDVRDLVGVLRRLVGGGGNQEVEANQSFRRFATQRGGELAGPNPSRVSWHVHNASDGTLLVREGGEKTVTLENYTHAIGPGENYDTQSVSAGEGFTGELYYAFVSSQDHDLSGFPAGTFLEASGGGLTFTERSTISQ